MKHILSLVLIAGLACTGLLGCNGGKTGPTGEETIDKNASYALGMDIGNSFKAGEIYPDMDELMQGMKDVLTDSKTRFTMENAIQILEQVFTELSEGRESAIRDAEFAFLAENSQKPGIMITESGLQYEVITEGDGPKPDPIDMVRVHYEGTLLDGSVFDSSYARGEPAEFSLMMVIPGWTEGLQLMSVGSKYRLFIPSDLAYGPQGRPQIPPYSTLIFEVELLDIIHDHD
ncbi:MAG: FKBP-type peptidyl-prolyl cis-trans isomerase [Treponema sp.]|nr:FKBP-type peptidyl-prolyl cis-trans isomerase [Treponema sp.]